MKHKLAAMIAAIVIGAGISVAAASPAQAHNQWGCPHGQSCVFQHFDGGGWSFNIVWSANPKDTCVWLPPFYRNGASSVVVDFGSGWDLFLYESVDCSDAPDRIDSPSHTNFQFFWWKNPMNHLNDDVEAFVIRCHAC